MRSPRSSSSARCSRSASRRPASANDGPLWARVFGFIALMLASVNIFGGFLVTERMLGMYKKKG